MTKRALITGLTGQDGSYIAELLLSKGYEVYGLMRRTSTPNTERVAHVLDQVKVVEGDMLDQSSLLHAVTLARPHEVYNFAAQSHVATSFREPEHTMNVNALGFVRLLEAVRLGCPLSDHVRVYQASTSELFGGAEGSTIQSEETPFSPQSPYAVSKLAAHHSAAVWRKAYGMHISCGISFNHESERRGEKFVTRWITKAIAAIKNGTSNEIRMGTLTARRDWSHAEDIVYGAWLMLQQERPDDYVLASGESRSVREFLDAAFNVAGLDVDKYLRIDPSLFRPNEVQALRGCAEKAHRKLGWVPKVSFNELVRRMVENDLRLAAPDTIARCTG